MIYDRILQKNEIIVQLLYRKRVYNASKLNVLFCKSSIFFQKTSLLFAFGEKILLIEKRENKVMRFADTI